MTTPMTCPFSHEDVDAVIQNLLKNIAFSSNTLTKIQHDTIMEAIPGAIIAAPALPDNKFSQDYYFYWVRDGAIVMESIMMLYLQCMESDKKADYRQIMEDYLSFVSIIQAQPALNGVNVLGEPKFNVDGTLWTGQWARPQNGGAAAQAMTLVCIATCLLNETNANNDALLLKIYDTNNSASLLKANLDYCAKVWQEQSFNAWEELYGDHFSVRIVQRAALLKGAALVTRMGDVAAAKYYTDQARHITNVLDTHWNEDLGYYFETTHKQNQEGGDIAVSVLINLLYEQIDDIDDVFSLTSPRVLSTAFYVRQIFENLYQVNVANRMQNDTGPLIGRYTSDIYDGNQSVYGNPWFLCSNLMAAFYYGVAREFLQGKNVTVTFLVIQFFSQVAPDITFQLNDVISPDNKKFNALIQQLLMAGDAILASVKKHCMTYSDGSILHMSEQINRTNGSQGSAPDLSWSYSSLISAVFEREKTMDLLNQL